MTTKKNLRKKSPWNWTPILESPQGLATLFDEIWFLHEALCPSSMKSEPFVRFLNEDSEVLTEIQPLVEYSSKDPDKMNKGDKGYIKTIVNLSSQPTFDRYNEVVGTVFGKKPGPENPIDNHSHGFSVGGIHVYGDSMRLGNIISDFLIARKLKEISNIEAELVTNRFTIPRILGHSTIHREAQLAEGITISRIPVLQKPDGLEMKGIEKVRKNIFLRDFRKKIASKAKGIQDVQLVVDEIQKEFERYRNELLIEKQKDACLMESCARNAVSFAIGILIPGASEAISFIEDSETRTVNWTGFIASLEVETMTN